MTKKKKVFYVTIDDSCGIDAISLVDYPAVERNFLCFKEEKPVKLNFDASKHVITGVVCLADTPIYRHDVNYGEYYVVFSKETIEKMVQKFAKDGLMKSVNLQHDDTKFVDGVFMYESFITDKERGINPKEFADIPNGSWIASFKVENGELWNEIINGNDLNGFSLQGFFNLKEQIFSKENLTFDEWIKKYLD